MTKTKVHSKPSKPVRVLGDGTTLGDAQANSARFAAEQCVRINSDLTTRYKLNFGAWATEVLAGKRNNQNPPQPPMAWVASLQPDGFSYEILGTAPVCDVPPIPEDHSEPVVVEKGTVDAVNVPPGDKRIPGSIVTGALLIALGASAVEIGDPKSIWVKQEKGGPWGVWKWYQRLT